MRFSRHDTLLNKKSLMHTADKKVFGSTDVCCAEAGKDGRYCIHNVCFTGYNTISKTPKNKIENKGEMNYG